MKQTTLLLAFIIPSLTLSKRNMAKVTVKNMSNTAMQCSFYQNNWAGAQQITSQTVAGNQTTSPLGARTSKGNTYSVTCWSPTKRASKSTKNNLKTGITHLKWGLKGWQ